MADYASLTRLTGFASGVPECSEMSEPDSEDEVASPRVGLLGELEVEMQLAKNGWHPVRLDTAQMAANADLVAVRNLNRVSIQVKTTDLEKQRGASKWLYVGHSTAFLRDQRTFFNAKSSPLVADIVVGVLYKENASRFFCFPVAVAEKLAQVHAEFWYEIPAKKRATGQMGKRSQTFPVWLCVVPGRQSHEEHHERIMRNVLRFENNWHVLKEPIKRLHDLSAWPLLQ
jgi:hypothetical protein